MTETVAIIAALVAAFTSLLAVLMQYFNSNRIRGYDEERGRAQLEMWRESNEKKLYEINARLTASEERWRDINHLLIASQRLQSEKAIGTKRVLISEFLKGAGVTEEDAVVEQDLVLALTPFHPDFQDIYGTIVETCRKIGLRVFRGDETNTPRQILPIMVKLLVRSRLVVAVIDGRSPNVYYELGIAHAIDKPTILVSRSLEDANRMVDMKSSRMIFYHNARDLEAQLQSELAKALVIQ